MCWCWSEGLSCHFGLQTVHGESQARGQNNQGGEIMWSSGPYRWDAQTLVDWQGLLSLSLSSSDSGAWNDCPPHRQHFLWKTNKRTYFEARGVAAASGSGSVCLSVLSQCWACLFDIAHVEVEAVRSARHIAPNNLSVLSCGNLSRQIRLSGLSVRPVIRLEFGFRWSPTRPRKV